MKNIALLLAIVIMAGPMVASAGQLKCQFEQRPDDYFFRHLPAEIVGFVNCSTPSDPMAVIYVARVAKADQPDLMKWFKSYEKVTVPGAVETRLIEKSGIESKSAWLSINSRRELDTMSHYLFTAQANDGEKFVFVYTQSHDRAQELSGTIKTLRQSLTKPEFISALIKELP